LKDEITAHAREEAPREACGLFSGRDGVPTRVIRCTNVHPMPTTRYVMDPREQLKAFRSIDAAGEELLGIYHSHPVSEPIPSPTDRAEAHYTGALYVLISLRSPTPEIRAFRIGSEREETSERFVQEVTLTS
jgi:proteasome lid subunit RPN8/RPN11